jgi:hypothetical protein
MMKWTVFNALGGLFWLAGLFYTKSAEYSVGQALPYADHPLAVGGALGLCGLAVLIWANIVSAT